MSQTKENTLPMAQAAAIKIPIADGEPEGLQRNFNGSKWMFFIYAVSFAMMIFHLLILFVTPVDPWIFSMGHLQFAVTLGYLYYAAHPKLAGKVHWTDILMVIISLLTYVYVLSDFDALIYRCGATPEPLDKIFGIMAIVTVVELCRRTAGLGMTILLLIFVAYCFAGPYLPGILWHKGYSFERVVSFLFSPSGIYNVPLNVTARFVYLFVLFGAFLELSGCATFFMDFAYAAAGRSRGGPAKVAIISSGLLGMVNGTSTGNVVTTGTLTIPLMKRTGYQPFFAGAVESTASTGGQVMPPVMGAAVFLMAQIMNVSYSVIMVSAAIPAFLYYAALYFSVDLEAARTNLLGLPKEQLPTWRAVGRVSYLAIPLFILMFYLIVLKSSIVLAGLMGIISAFAVGVAHHLIAYKKLFSFQRILDAVRDGGVNIIQISATCAAAGIIIGVLTLTGLGLKIATLVVSFSHGNLLICLILTMIVTIILGMGMPTIAAYAIPAAVIVPAMVKMGVPLLPAHMFVLYYAALSAITPPVALASYAAAAIAGCDPIKLAIVALKLALAGFIIPYMFVYGPELLLLGDVPSIILASATGFVGVFCLSLTVIGYFKTHMSMLERCMTMAAALTLIKPGLFTDLIGIALLGTVIVWQIKKSRRTGDAARGPLVSTPEPRSL